MVKHSDRSMDQSRGEVMMWAVLTLIVITFFSWTYFCDDCITKSEAIHYDGVGDINIEVLSQVYNKVLFINTNNFTWRHGNNTYNGVNAFYRPGDFFCVSVINRTLEEVSKSTFHEIAHHFNWVELEHYKNSVDQWSKIK